MMRSLYTAATGMGAQQRNIDVTANNLANVNTTGFKKSRVHFQDLLYHNERNAGVPASLSTQVPVGLHVGHGEADLHRKSSRDRKSTEHGQRSGH